LVVADLSGWVIDHMGHTHGSLSVAKHILPLKGFVVAGLVQHEFRNVFDSLRGEVGLFSWVQAFSDFSFVNNFFLTL